MNKTTLPKLDLITDKTELRPSLNFIEIDKDLIATVTDGHILIRTDLKQYQEKPSLKVIFEDYEGKIYIHHKGWKLLRMNKPVAFLLEPDGEYFLKLRDPKYPEQTIKIRVYTAQEMADAGTPFPEYENVYPKQLTEGIFESAGFISFNPEYIYLVYKALNFDYTDCPVYSFNGANKAIILTSTNLIGFVLIMPVMITTPPKEQIEAIKHLTTPSSLPEPKKELKAAQ